MQEDPFLHQSDGGMEFGAILYPEMKGFTQIDMGFEAVSPESYQGW